jgi:hypothetical protein
MALEVVWNGSMRDVYLCIPPVRVGTIRGNPGEIFVAPRKPWSSREALKVDLLRLLPLKQEWEITELIERLSCDRSSVYGLLYHLKVAKQVTSRGYGKVAWVSR